MFGTTFREGTAAAAAAAAATTATATDVVRAAACRGSDSLQGRRSMEGDEREVGSKGGMDKGERGAGERYTAGTKVTL